MSLGWDATRRRHRLVQAVLDDIERSGRPTVPLGLRAEVDAEFGDLGGFLAEVLRRWYRTFDARLDEVLEDGPDDMRGALRALWRSVDRDLAASRLLLDAHAAHPALADVDSHHGQALFAATGVEQGDVRAGPDESGCRASKWWRRGASLSRSSA